MKLRRGAATGRMAAVLTDGGIVGDFEVEFVHDGHVKLAGMAALTERIKLQIRLWRGRGRDATNSLALLCPRSSQRPLSRAFRACSGQDYSDCETLAMSPHVKMSARLVLLGHNA